MEVFAALPGEKYNIGVSDFKLPGLKGDPRYTKIYARSKTEMEGGFVGMVKTASPADIAKAEGELKTKIRDNLLKAAASEKPEGYVLYDNAVYVETETISPPEGSEVVVRGTLYGVIFDKKKLSKYLAQRLVSSYEEGDIEATQINELTFNMESLAAKPWQNGSITFSLKGKTPFVYLFDEERLKQDLMAVPKEQVPSVLKAYPSIERAEVVLRPFWRSNLPDDPDKIKVVKKLP